MTKNPKKLLKIRASNKMDCRLLLFPSAFCPQPSALSLLPLYLIMQNEPNLNIYRLELTKENKRSWNDFHKPNVKKTNPIRTQNEPKRTQFWANIKGNEPNTNPIYAKRTQDKPNFYNTQQEIIRSYHQMLMSYVRKHSFKLCCKSEIPVFCCFLFFGGYA